MNSDSAVTRMLQSPLAIVCGVLYVTAFAISLFMKEYHDIQYSFVIALLCVAGISGFVPALTKHGLTLPGKAPALLILTFWSFIALSLSWSSVPYSSILSFCIFSALPLSFFAIILSPERKHILRMAGILMLPVMAILSLWGLYQYFISGSGYGYRAMGPLLNPNSLACLVNMALLPVIAFFLYARDKKMMLVWFGFTALFFAALMATESRSGFAAFFVSAIVLFLFSRNAPGVTMAKAGWLTSAFFIIFIGMYAANPRSRLGPRLAETFNPMNAADGTFTERLLIWGTSLKLALANFWTGTGFGTFYLYYPSIQPEDDRSNGFWAHMDPLQFWTELGIAGPILFYGVLVSVLVYTIKALKVMPRDSAIRPYIWASFSALLALALQSHLTYNLYVMAALVGGGIALAAWYSYVGKALGDGFSLIHKKSQIAMSCALIFGFALLTMLIAASAASGSGNLKKALRFKRTNDLEAFQQAIVKAERWAPVSFIDPEVELAENNIEMIRALDRAGTSYNRADLLSHTEGLLNEAEYWNPAWPRITTLRAELYDIAGDAPGENNQAKAQGLWLEALQKSPRNFNTRRGLGEYYIRRGQVEKAFIVFREALQYPRKTHMQDVYYKNQIEQLRPLVQQVQEYRRNKGVNKPESVAEESPSP